MRPTLTREYGVKAPCPDCGAVSVFDCRRPDGAFGHVLVKGDHKFRGKSYTKVDWILVRCSGCGRGGLAEIHVDINHEMVLDSFHPRSLVRAPLPPKVPHGIHNEYREAEFCASFGAYRAASALLRSTLEKALKASGYTKGMLEPKIDEAAKDGVITDARKKKAHDDIRVLGNEVSHDDWRPIDEDEVVAALHYAQRILEDLYDDRDAVTKILREKGRLPAGGEA